MKMQADVRPLRELGPDEIVACVVAGDRNRLAQAMTLLESSKDSDRVLGASVLEKLPGGSSIRVGITGVPGAGKSTFIEALGTYLVGQSLTVAVLAIDPSSTVSGGSVLGDKTRMQFLAGHPSAFIRPSPTRGHLGGVTSGTWNLMRLLEAANFDVILVETVGVGQSEVMVADLVDTVVWLTLPDTGDELQTAKRGVVETADIAIVNKADLNPERSAAAARDLATALHYLPRRWTDWHSPVLTVSSVSSVFEPVWRSVLEHRTHISEQLPAHHQNQRRVWFWRMLQQELLTNAGQEAEKWASLAADGMEPLVAARRSAEAVRHT